MIGKMKERGITLVALVVTIIIILILAGVTLNIALSENGLLKKAQESTEKYKQAQNEEEESVSDIAKVFYNDYVGKYVTGYSLESNSTVCTIGTQTSGIESEQLFTKDIDMQWRIWDYDGTTLRLISDKPTSNKLHLKGVAGYNNGLWAMNEICRKCYTDQSIPNEYIEVRSLRKSDIEKVCNYNYTEYEQKSDTDNNTVLIHFGEAKKYNTNFQAPKMWTEHDINWNYKYDKSTKMGIGNSDCKNPWEQEFGSDTDTELGITTKDTEFKQSYDSHDYEETEFDNPKYYEMIFKNGNGEKIENYWLAKRIVDLFEDPGHFGFARVTTANEANSIYGYSTFYSNRKKC